MERAGGAGPERWQQVMWAAASASGHPVHVSLPPALCSAHRCSSRCPVQCSSALAVSLRGPPQTPGSSREPLHRQCDDTVSRLSGHG